MTGDVNLTHIRDALNDPWETVWVTDEAEPERGPQPSIVERDTAPALAQLAAAEAVIQAARDLTESVGISGFVPARSMIALAEALAALGDGQ